MERDYFTSLLKDLLPHLHDYAVLETHPLVVSFTPPAGFSGSRGEAVQRLIIEAVEGLQPREVAFSTGAVEWRPYLILHKRYIKGLPLQEISASLNLSERQVRRDHHRALKALSGRLYDQFYLYAAQPERNSPGQDGAQPMPSIIEEHSSRLPEESLLSQPDQSYQVEANLVDLSDLMRGAVGVMEKRLADEDVDLEISLPTPAPQVLADRIILRQVLFSLFKYVLHMLSGKTIQITLEAKGLLRFNFQVDANWSFWREEEYDDLLKSVHSWSERLEVGLRESYPAYGQDGQAEIILEFGTPSRRTVLVVDDQPAALRMFERYLSRSGYEVVGVSDPSQVQILAKQLKPALITLDVMMPRLDGWEVMQALKLDEDTRSIPVVVCSAWEEPELAHSLGAAGFLKKPVTQKDLLGMIDQITRL